MKQFALISVVKPVSTDTTAIAEWHKFLEALSREAFPDKESQRLGEGVWLIALDNGLFLLASVAAAAKAHNLKPAVRYLQSQ